MIHSSTTLQKLYEYLTVDEMTELKRLASTLPENPTVVNIGAGVGLSALVFLESRPDLKLITIDNVSQSNPNGSLEGEAGVLQDAGYLKQRRSSQIHGSSSDEGNKWFLAKVDMVFIDGDHSYPGCSGDINNWLINIKEGGFIVVTNYRKKTPPQWGGIDLAVENHLVNKGFKRVSLVDSLITFEVTSRRTVTSLSDNRVYPQTCIKAVNDYEFFDVFRRDPTYNQILEHVSFEQGVGYLKIISEDEDLLARIEDFKRNDEYGGPIKWEYPEIGLISPTTLRYIKVLKDLKDLFGDLEDMHVCEIGVGYGGQCRVINACNKPDYYTLVDIKPALNLSQRYLDNYSTSAALMYKTGNELYKGITYDLVISNYAFTELYRGIQEVYIERVIKNSKRGYITYNKITPGHFYSYTLEELLEIIPGSRTIAEEPLTHPDNCIIVWGDN